MRNLLCPAISTCTPSWRHFTGVNQRFTKARGPCALPIRNGGMTREEVRGACNTKELPTGRMTIERICGNKKECSCSTSARETPAELFPVRLCLGKTKQLLAVGDAAEEVHV